MAIAAAVVLLLAWSILDDTGIIACVVLLLGILFGSTYVVGIAWHMAM